MKWKLGPKSGGVGVVVQAATLCRNAGDARRKVLRGSPGIMYIIMQTIGKVVKECGWNCGARLARIRKSG